MCETTDDFDINLVFRAPIKLCFLLPTTVKSDIFRKIFLEFFQKRVLNFKIFVLAKKAVTRRHFLTFIVKVTRQAWIDDKLSHRFVRDVFVADQIGDKTKLAVERSPMFHSLNANRRSKFPNGKRQIRLTVQKLASVVIFFWVFGSENKPVNSYTT